MRKKTKLVQGWGVNDVLYPTSRNKKVNGKQRRVWVCPYYRDWENVLRRCFSQKLHESRPTYAECTICEEWKYLSNFIDWVDSQPNKDWQNCSLDKDLLVDGNKHYSPNTCVYTTNSVNVFVTNSAKNRGVFMLGVSWQKGVGKFQAHCSNPFTLQQEYLGCFPTELEAHLTWKAKKHKHACKLADIQSDERVAKRLREMYSEYQDLTVK